jgi:hypothetical protein
VTEFSGDFERVFQSNVWFVFEIGWLDLKEVLCFDIVKFTAVM